MKCKNTRSSGKTLGVAPVAWTWEQTLIPASALGHPEGSTFEPARCVCCTIPTDVIFSLNLNQTWTNFHRSMTLSHIISLHRLNIAILKLNQTLSKKFKQNYQIQFQIRLARNYEIQIHQKTANPQDLYPNPCSSLIDRGHWGLTKPCIKHANKS